MKLWNAIRCRLGFHRWEWLYEWCGVGYEGGWWCVFCGRGRG